MKFTGLGAQLSVYQVKRYFVPQKSGANYQRDVFHKLLFLVMFSNIANVLQLPMYMNLIPNHGNLLIKLVRLMLFI